MKRLSYLIFISSLFLGNSFAFEYQSTEKQTHLIELYTSQSCSSCPSAQSWLNDLEIKKGFWNDFIPVAFHVSYWNYLSWKDPYSKEEFSQRQRRYHRIIKTGVYTPQVLVNGRDYHQRRVTPTGSPERSPGVLKVKITQEKAIINFEGLQDFGSLNCFIAIVADEKTTQVKDGENRGRRLKEKFIVTNLFQIAAEKNKNTYKCSMNVDYNKNSKVVAWMAKDSNLEVVQVTGGNLK